MSLKDKWAEFVDWANKKRAEMERKRFIENMEPKVLKAIMADLKAEVQKVNAIENEAERAVAVKELMLKIDEVEGIVNDVLAHVQNNIERSQEGMNNWLTREAHYSDYNGLNKGRILLLNMKDEIGTFRGELAKGPAQASEQHQAQPGEE